MPKIRQQSWKCWQIRQEVVLAVLRCSCNCFHPVLCGIQRLLELPQEMSAPVLRREGCTLSLSPWAVPIPALPCKDAEALQRVPSGLRSAAVSSSGGSLTTAPRLPPAVFQTKPGHLLCHQAVREPSTHLFSCSIFITELWPRVEKPFSCKGFWVFIASLMDCTKLFPCTLACLRATAP